MNRKGRPILQYNFDGTLVSKWNSIKEASNSLKLCRESIRKSCNELTLYVGCHWRFYIEIYPNEQ